MVRFLRVPRRRLSRRGRLFRACLLVAVGVVWACVSIAADDNATEKLVLHTRRRVETEPGSGKFELVADTREWDSRKTALVICDMWDRHWCAGANRRVAEMAPRLNAVVDRARRRGVLIIHCPSGTVDFYKDTPQRMRAQRAPKVETDRPLVRWCPLDREREGALPVDDSDGGCDCSPACRQDQVRARQIATIGIEPADAITDSDEAFYLMRARGIENVIVTGVHTNMCVLGRPFGIRQLVYQGQEVVLMRDLTDTMYNSRKSPYVSHFAGTELVVEHIEKHWCPTVTSVDFLGGSEFRFAEDRRE